MYLTWKLLKNILTCDFVSHVGACYWKNIHLILKKYIEKYRKVRVWQQLSIGIILGECS